jgi:repressor LexA
MPLDDHQPLTRGQQTIFDAILFFSRKGELPTVREVGALVGLRSPSTVYKHLRALENRKLISLNGKSRGIRITPGARVAEIQAAGVRAEGAREDAVLQAPLPEFGPKFRRMIAPKTSAHVPLVGAIAAGRPFESYSDAFTPNRGFLPSNTSNSSTDVLTGMAPEIDGLPLDPRMFVESGETFALRIEGDSMIQAGILDGDYVIIRRQNTVEEGEIAAVIINGEGTLKRWRTHPLSSSNNSSSLHDFSSETKKSVRLLPENENFDPIEITEADAKEVLVFGKYVGLVRGNLRF